MFKKDFSYSTSNQLSQKDWKRLWKDLEKILDNQSIADLFINVEQLHVNKIEKSKMTIYASDTDPLLVDATSKGDFFPTVYTLQMTPRLVKGYLVLKPGIEKIALKG